ncbi:MULTISPECIES: hypothetical protein [Paenibacillus]|uniref:6,7-dimethyl-8-ribityllumazine synthase n=2 Tax=Paenibacillus TaxID=44249 RepID=A0ABS7KLI9_9BACL|nr:MULTISPECIES: hypothetical protein [Paenibacillus]MBY0205053.1 hypothetical protein [Paenibacillus cucumis (ex Kampfer et al. 2016)]
MQNPITIGMIKYGDTNEDVTSYIKELKKIIEGLNPLFIYVEQNDLEHSFRKARYKCGLAKHSAETTALQTVSHLLLAGL